MGEILMFEPRPRPGRSGTARSDMPGAEIVFFLGVRYEPYIEASAAQPIKAKPRKRTPGAPPSGKPKKRPA